MLLLNLACQRSRYDSCLIQGLEINYGSCPLWLHSHLKTRDSISHLCNSKLHSFKLIYPVWIHSTSMPSSCEKFITMCIQINCLLYIFGREFCLGMTKECCYYGLFQTCYPKRAHWTLILLVDSTARLRNDSSLITLSASSCKADICSES